MKNFCWHDIFNPVLVKEMRQYFNNRLLVLVMALLLAGEFLALLLAAVVASHGGGGIGVFIGEDLASGVMAMSWLAIMLICGLGSLARFRAERSHSELDYGNVTPLSAHAIVRGKLLGALAMMLFIAALNLPFIVISYFLRGVSLPDVALVFVFIVAMGVIVTLTGLIFGAASNRKLIWVYVAGCAALSIIVVSGVSHLPSLADSSEFWYFLLALVPIAIECYALAVAAASQPGRDRFLLFRIVTVMLLALFPLLAVLEKFSILDVMDAIKAGMIVCMLLLMLLASVSSWETAAHSAVMLSKVPRRLVPRLLRFLFSGGSWGGIVLSALLIAGFAATAVMNKVDKDLYNCAISFSVYFLAYAMIACLVHEFTRYTPWKCWFFSFIGCFILPMVMWLAAGEKRYSGLLTVLPMGFDEMDSTMFGVTAVSVLFAASLVFIARSFMVFRRLDPAAPRLNLSMIRNVAVPRPKPAAAPVPEVSTPAPEPAPEPAAAKELFGGKAACRRPQCWPILTEEFWNPWALHALRRDVHHKFFWFSIPIMLLPQALVMIAIYASLSDLSDIDNWLFLPIIFHAFWVLGNMARNWQTFALFSSAPPLIRHLRDFAPFSCSSVVRGLSVHWLIVSGYCTVLLAPVLLAIIKFGHDPELAVYWIVMEPLLVYGVALLLLVIRSLKLDLIVYIVVVAPILMMFDHRNDMEDYLPLTVIVQLACCAYFAATFCGENQTDPARQEWWRRLWQLAVLALAVPAVWMLGRAGENLMLALGGMAMIGAAASAVGPMPDAMRLRRGSRRSWWRMLAGCRVSYIGFPWALAATAVFLTVTKHEFGFLTIAVAAYAAIAVMQVVWPRLLQGRIGILMPLIASGAIAALTAFANILFDIDLSDSELVGLYGTLAIFGCLAAAIMQASGLSSLISKGASAK